MEPMLRNLDHGTVLTLKDQIVFQSGQINSKTLAQNKLFSLTLFAFDKGEAISSHESSGDAMVLVLEGTGQVTIDDTEYTLQAGECIVMPARRPHAVTAPERFKMLLTIVFPQTSSEGV